MESLSSELQLHQPVSVERHGMEDDGTHQLDVASELNLHFNELDLTNVTGYGLEPGSMEPHNSPQPSESYRQEHQDTQQELQDPLRPSSPISPDPLHNLLSPIASPRPLRIPSLSPSALSNLDPQAGPTFSSADDPPPYSPTHTILPHYFSLEPIPVRTYIIKDSDTMPSLLDFWLCASAPSSRPQSPTMMQQRGMMPTHHNELKYSIIRPVQTDRTAIPITSTAAPNAYFIPALALIATDHPERWIWWGTEALQMVIFGRQLKNIIMEWKWKAGRSRIGGPVVHRLIGCSFRVTPERQYCWKLGTGKQRSGLSPRGRHHNRNWRSRERRRNQGGDLSGPGDTTTNRAVGGSGGWFGSFFSSRSPPILNPAIAMSGVEADLRVAIPPDHGSATPDTTPSVQDHERRSAESDDDDDEEFGAFHCREYSSDGITGRIVAIYRPGRRANRARDRPATSRKLEVFAEVGERCETAMMMMCARIDDLFMSIPDQKKGPFVSLQSEGGSSGGLGASANSSHDTGDDDTDRFPSQRIGETEGHVGAVRVSILQRIAGDRKAWKQWTKWVTAAVLITVVVILVLKPKIGL
ncbi:hypothetical protein BGZ92_006044 [Podila epicladia]|nr:hypothetical protein BGZ92_006044 [Podila epicladia]